MADDAGRNEIVAFSATEALTLTTSAGKVGRAVVLPVLPSLQSNRLVGEEEEEGGRDEQSQTEVMTDFRTHPGILKLTLAPAHDSS